MGTKTVDGTGPAEAAEANGVLEADEAAEAAHDEETAEVAEPEDAEAAGTAKAPEEQKDAVAGPSGVGQGAGAVVSAALGLVSLTGSWIGTVAAARETLIGQLETSSSAGVAEQVQAVYGNAWQTSALWGGLFALLALVVGAAVLARPAFGAPGRPQAGWIKSVAWGGVALGALGLLLAVLKYTDVLLGLPSTS
ncbi:hypothetical protein [Streptomyces sp. DH24]|uniref:hypothetical protein n=1 Tax=Streptomyces sp. DH24 TaxID=3040123 RepID=UPI0024419793|nr:hypothetical protein [Streptomyces sp. DH24]MDG9718789.1 hypothetical protein [Streptomyces sp. DH24]